MITLYVAVSLTHVKTEQERQEIRDFLKWLEVTFHVRILTWAFDLDTWTPLPVDDIYEYDTKKVLAADMMIVLYLSNDGSDGRGGEVVNRTNSGKPILAFAREGVKVSRYSADRLKGVGSGIKTFRTFTDMEDSINRALLLLP